MKCIHCNVCGDTVICSHRGIVYKCECGKCSAKYLNDGVTMVVSGNPLLIGIDNNSFEVAVKRAQYHINEEFPHRVDFFFTGWTTTKPGEVLFVKTEDEVRYFDENEYDETDYSTMPNGDTRIITLER